MIPPNVIDWLLACDEPWTVYRTRVDFLGQSPEDAEVHSARQALMNDPRIRSLVIGLGELGSRSFTRHNDASHPLYKLTTLAEFGLRAGDPGLAEVTAAATAHQSPEGAYQSLVNISPAFGGSGVNQWSWLACDAPTVLYALLALNVECDANLQRAIEHLASLVTPAGWQCTVAPELGKFRGPGRKSDPCPMANVYALKALSLAPTTHDNTATRSGAEMLLRHWEQRDKIKPYLFGIGSDFRKLKYPFVWYDLLHVLFTLSRFDFIKTDPRFGEMRATLQSQSDNQGRFTAGSMYQAWKGWSFADKKQPSPWLTFLAWKVLSGS